jgi:nitrogen regulatory protein P-II 1
MKRIDAIIRPHQLEDVKNRLTGIGVEGITVSEVRGFGRQKGHTEVYRGAEYSVDLLPKIQLTILASDEQAPKILEAISEGARTGQIGDGKIFVTALEEVIRIRTGDRGEAAL